MKKSVLSAVLCALSLCAAAQEKAERLDSVVVSASRAGRNTPVSYENVGKEALRQANPMHSLPMALELLPSVVTYNEGGTGLGNSAMTIRGSKGSQINVTLNGITLNDAESQEVFWVNIPSLSSLISSVQVQRGLGTSANGAGAFGASINMNTAFVSPEPWVSADISAGSYNTFITTVSGSTGRSRKGWYGTAAYSHGSTDGYIRNAFVRSQSAFVTLGWLGRRNSVRLTWLMGRQRSGITWDGISLEQYRKDRRYNGAGEYYDGQGNVYYYDNQTDNYVQHHLQANYTHAFTTGLYLTVTANYTYGNGYDEYYKVNRKLVNYGFPQEQGRSDIIYQKRMENSLLVGQAQVKYARGKWNASAGLSESAYLGFHNGKVLWAKQLGADYPYGQLDWYGNSALKLDFSVFARAEYRPLDWLTAYADLQFRGLDYRLEGTDDDWLEYGGAEADRLSYQRDWNFFNPRAGVTAAWGRHKLYASAALGHREPGRGDIKDNVKGEASPIGPERMLDLEAGYAFSSGRLSASANLYLMEYWDMLLETGRLSSSGYAIKENVPRAWRRGVELSAAWEPLRWLRLDGNATLSLNRIADYTSYIPYADYSGTHAVHYGRTTMLLSPSLVGMARLTLQPWKGGQLALDTKYVGKQFLDNSMRDEMAIPAYWVAHLLVGHTFTWKGRQLGITAYVNNLFNRLYFASGWRWESFDPSSGQIETGIGVYPQAPCNFMVKLSLSL